MLILIGMMHLTLRIQRLGVPCVVLRRMHVAKFRQDFTSLIKLEGI